VPVHRGDSLQQAIATRARRALHAQASLFEVFPDVVFMAVFTGSAAAHPHVWVTARAQVIFNAKGEIEAIRQAWTFDEMYSAFVTEGQGKGRPAVDQG